MISDNFKHSWDPTKWKDPNKPTTLCFNRIKKDIQVIYTEPLPLIFVVPEEDDITKIHAVISGPENTPYEGGFFYFFIKIPSNYPIVAPKVKLMTTGNGLVRFNPNLYCNGKVCLSIIGTWKGPPWTAAQSLQSLLMSIQSLLNENPYSNEPGFDHQKKPTDSKSYNDYIRHETLRVAVCDMLEGRVSMPDPLKVWIAKSFLEYTDFYGEVIASNIKFDSTDMFCPYGKKVGKFDYGRLVERIREVTKSKKEQYNNEMIVDEDEEEIVKYDESVFEIDFSDMI